MQTGIQKHWCHQTRARLASKNSVPGTEFPAGLLTLYYTVLLTFPRTNECCSRKKDVQVEASYNWHVCHHLLKLYHWWHWQKSTGSDRNYQQQAQQWPGSDWQLSGEAGRQGTKPFHPSCSIGYNYVVHLLIWHSFHDLWHWSEHI